MINKITESFELSEVENKALNEFQNILFQMKERATRKETQHVIENIYYNIISLISINEWVFRLLKSKFITKQQ